MAANNLDLNFGSPLDVIYNTQIAFMRDMDTAGRNTKNEIRDLERERINYTARAKSSKDAAGYAKTAGTISALSGAASGVGNLIAPGGAWADIF